MLMYICTIQECVLSRSVYYPGVCTIQECVLSRSVCYPGVCTIQECVLSRSVYCPGVCTIQEYVLSGSMYCPGTVLTKSNCIQGGLMGKALPLAVDGKGQTIVTLVSVFFPRAQLIDSQQWNKVRICVAVLSIFASIPVLLDVCTYL